MTPVTLAHHPADVSVPLLADPVGALLGRQAMDHPDRVAVSEWHPDRGELRSLTYRELHAAASDAAAGLLTVAAPGERIGLWAPNGIDWLVVEYAAALAGLVLVPVNPALSPGEVEELLRRSRCVAVLTVAAFRERFLLDTALQMVGRLPDLRRALDLAAWRDELGCGDRGVLPEVRPEQPFLVQYTSGTTGAPKGAVLTHRVAVNVGAMTVPLLGLGTAPVWCNPMPLHHVGGSVCVALTMLAAGGTLVLFPAFEPATVLDLLERTGATVLGAVPTMVLALLDHPEFPRHDLGRLQVLQIGGSTVAPALIRRAEEAIGARIVNAYGQSEAPSAVQTRLDDSDEVKALTIGRPGLHREAMIAVPGTGETAAVGETGELWVRSPLTMSGYLDDPGQTVATLDELGWLHTGDLCAMDPTGVVTLHGRLRDVVIRGGENVYPAEVEAVLLKHPAVADVAVVGLADEHWGEQVAAVVRLRPGSDPAWSELEAFARAHLAGFKVPRAWRSVEAFPLTASGKVQKFRLPDLFG